MYHLPFEAEDPLNNI